MTAQGTAPPRFMSPTRRRIWKDDRRAANVSLVGEGIDRWRLQNDPADDHGPTMAEFIVQLLEQEGRLR